MRDVSIDLMLLVVGMVIGATRVEYGTWQGPASALLLIAIIIIVALNSTELL